MWVVSWPCESISTSPTYYKNFVSLKGVSLTWVLAWVKSSWLQSVGGNLTSLILIQIALLALTLAKYQYLLQNVELYHLWILHAYQWTSTLHAIYLWWYRWGYWIKKYWLKYNFNNPIHVIYFNVLISLEKNHIHLKIYSNSMKILSKFIFQLSMNFIRNIFNFCLHQ